MVTRKEGKGMLRRNTKVDATVYIFRSEVQAITGEAKRFPDNETGRDLYGTFTHGNMPVIWLASGPGPKAKHFPTHFEQDVRFMNHWQSRLMEEFGLQYVGSWHSHHTLSLSQPSPGDMRSAKNYAANHGRKRTLEIITNHEGRKMVTCLRPYFYPNAQEGGWIPASFTTLASESPLRSRLGLDEVAFSNNLDWREIPHQAYTFGTSAAPEVADVPTSEGSDFPPELEAAIGRLECDGIEVEERGDFFMLTIPAGLDRVLAVLVKNSGSLGIVQVNYIDRTSGVNENIMSQIRQAGIPLSIRGNQPNVLRDIFAITGDLVG
jgi:hypothetical protein